LGFALESGEALGVRGEGIGQNLDGDVAIQLPVSGAVDLSHASRADLREDFVCAETNAGRKRHRNMGRRRDYTAEGHADTRKEPSRLERFVVATGGRFPFLNDVVSARDWGTGFYADMLTAGSELTSQGSEPGLGIDPVEQ
jgi:hypothetical protein